MGGRGGRGPRQPGGPGGFGTPIQNAASANRMRTRTSLCTVLLRMRMSPPSLDAPQ